MIKTVFVSSTFTDLRIHRKAIWEALQKFNVTVRGMEQFGARTETPLQTCISEVDLSDIYIGIIAYRLGSIEPQSGKSYTQLEYERALNLSKKILIYLIDDDNAKVCKKFIDLGEANEKLESFKSILRDRHTIETFIDEDGLVEKIKRDLLVHVQNKLEPATSHTNDEIYLNRLKQFSIFPKVVSGTEIRIGLKLKGDLYPVSKDVCDAFNLEFGTVAGVAVEIIVPNDSGMREVPDLLLPFKLLENNHSLKIDDVLDCFVKLHFSPKAVSANRARFRTRIDYPDSKLVFDNAMFDLRGRPVIQPADSLHAFEASQIISVTQKN